MKRRKIRKYKRGKRKSGVKFLWIIGIILSAVILGYFTARFVVGPILGYDTEVLKLEFPSNLIAKDGEEAKKNEGKFALQYGVFENKERASKLASELKDAGISASLYESGSKYKVISHICSSKEKAIEELSNIKTDIVDSVFVTTL